MFLRLLKHEVLIFPVLLHPNLFWGRPPLNKRTQRIHSTRSPHTKNKFQFRTAFFFGISWINFSKKIQNSDILVAKLASDYLIRLELFTNV